MPSLFVIQGRDQGTRFRLDGSTVTIGRGTSNAVQLHDTEVSREHAEFSRRGERSSFAISAAPTARSSTASQIKEHELASGDQVQLGRTLLLYTGVTEGRVEDLADKINIVSRHDEDDGSRIVHSMHQSEGSEILTPPDNETSSPWLARARSNLQIMYRTALAVSHTLDIDQLLARIMDMIFEWVDADRGCIMLKDLDTGQARAQGPPPSPRRAVRRADHDQPNDSRLRRRSQRRRAHQQRPRRRPLGRRQEHLAAGRPRGDLRADAGPLRRRRRDLHRYVDHAAAHAAARLRQQVHARAPQADDRHRPSGGARGRRYVVLQGDGASRTARGRRPDDRLALAPHQEHSARRPRRQLPHRNGHEGPRQGDGRRRDRRRSGRRRPSTSCAKAGASSRRTRSASRRS